MLALYLSVLDDRNFEEDFTEVYNTYKRLVYHTAYKIMDDSYLAEDVLQEVFLYVAKNFSKIHRENCHELAAYLVSCSRSRAYDMLRKQREELLEDVPNEPDAAPVPDDAAVSTDNIERLTELIGQMKPMQKFLQYGKKSPYRVLYSYTYGGKIYHHKSHLLWDKPYMKETDSIAVYINDSEKSAIQL